MMQHYAPTLGRCYLLRPHPQLPLNSSSSVIINILSTTYTLTQQFVQVSPAMPYMLAPLMLPEVLNFKPTHARICSPFQSNSSPFPVRACYLRTSNATEQRVSGVL